MCFVGNILQFKILSYYFEAQKPGILWVFKRLWVFVRALVVCSFLSFVCFILFSFTLYLQKVSCERPSLFLQYENYNVSQSFLFPCLSLYNLRSLQRERDQSASVSFPKRSTRVRPFAFSCHLRTEEELASDMICFNFTIQQKGVS